MKSMNVIKTIGGVAALTLALAANAQVTVTGPASNPPAAHESVGAHVSDAAVTTKVKAQLATTSGLKALHIHVKTRAGVVRLTGTVPDSAQKSLAEEATKNVDGVKSVHNNLKIVAEKPL